MPQWSPTKLNTPSPQETWHSSTDYAYWNNLLDETPVKTIHALWCLTEMIPQTWANSEKRLKQRQRWADNTFWK